MAVKCIGYGSIFLVSIGAVISGHNISTWQFWVFTMPAAIGIGLLMAMAEG